MSFTHAGNWRHLAHLGVAASLTLGLAAQARSQHTPDPYNIVGEYNNQYEPYMYANYPTTPGTQPNQGRLDGRAGVRNANAFQKFLDSEGDEPADLGRSTPRPSGPGTPYYRAYRQFDQEFQRTYRPNEAADKSYYSERTQRNEKYFQALREPDPRKRSQLLRDYNLDNMRSARNLSGGRNATDRDREPTRDTMTPGGASLYPDDSKDKDKVDAVRPSPSAPLSRRPATGLAPLAAPPPSRVGSGASAPSSRVRALTPTPGLRSSRTLAPLARPTSPVSSEPSPTEVLRRSELLDRALRP